MAERSLGQWYAVVNGEYLSRRRHYFDICEMMDEVKHIIGENTPEQMGQVVAVECETPDRRRFYYRDDSGWHASVKVWRNVADLYESLMNERYSGKCLIEFYGGAFNMLYAHADATWNGTQVVCESHTGFSVKMKGHKPFIRDGKRIFTVGVTLPCYIDGFSQEVK